MVLTQWSILINLLHHPSNNFTLTTTWIMVSLLMTLNTWTCLSSVFHFKISPKVVSMIWLQIPWKNPVSLNLSCILYLHVFHQVLYNHRYGILFFSRSFYSIDNLTMIHHCDCTSYFYMLVHMFTWYVLFTTLFFYYDSTQSHPMMQRIGVTSMFSLEILLHKTRLCTI